MSMKKALASLLAVAMLAGCGSSSTSSTTTDDSASATTGEAFESTLYPTPDGVTYTASATNSAAPDWTEYDALIEEIKTTTDLEERVQLMHQAEDIVMGTGALIPLYYYNDIYLQKSDVTGIYGNAYGFKWFCFATCPRDVLKVNIASEPAKVDPALNSTVDGAILCVNMFAGLYTYDADGNLVPDLCDPENPYEVSEDGMTYTFHLIDSQWSDGSAVTANDFVYAWNRVADPETGADYQYMFDAIARKDDGVTLDIEATDDNTLVVNLGSPCAYFLDLCAFPAYLPVPEADVEAADTEGNNPGAWCTEAGFKTNGAYTMTSWTHNESLVLTKNPYYHRADEVTIEEIDFMLSDDDTAILAAYQAGDLDFADTVPNGEVASLIDDPEFYIADNLGTYYAAWNVNSSLFEGKTVDQAIAMRKAFSLLIDRQYICDTVGQTGQVAATSFIPAGMADGNGGIFKTASEWAYPNGEDGYYPVEVTDDAIEEARQLLMYAGYEFDDDGMLSDSTPLNITYLTNDGTSHVAAAESMQSDVAVIGINMTIETQEWAVFVDERKAGNFDFCREGWLADFNDPINMLEMWTSDSGNNDAQFGK